MRKNGKSVGFTLDEELDTVGLVIKALNGRFEHENLRNPRYGHLRKFRWETAGVT